MSVLAVESPTLAPKPAPPLEKMPGHWVLAKMGKRVLRPGGVELTRRMLASLAIDSKDDVVEFAPGLGFTAQLTLQRRPRTYTAIERDAAAAATVSAYLHAPAQRCKLGTAEETGLPEASASVVYGIHELCLTDDADDEIAAAIARDLSDEIHVGVKPLRVGQWRALMEGAGLSVIDQHLAPMHLLEPARVIADEGLWRAIRFAWNTVRTPAARRRVLAMRRAFRNHRRHLAAIVLVAVKS